MAAGIQTLLSADQVGTALFAPKTAPSLRYRARCGPQFAGVAEPVHRLRAAA
jgi:hypothetical protein